MLEGSVLLFRWIIDFELQSSSSLHKDVGFCTRPVDLLDLGVSAFNLREILESYYFSEWSGLSVKMKFTEIFNFSDKISVQLLDNLCKIRPVDVSSFDWHTKSRKI